MKRMASNKRKTIGFLAAAALTLGVTLAPAAAASAATAAPVQKAIMLDGSVISHPATFVFQGTTYMPLASVMQLAAKLQIQNHWDGIRRVWNVTDPGFKTSGATFPNPAPDHMAITVNQKPVFSNLPRLVRKAPGTDVWTTYVPIYFVMRLFDQLAIVNHWNGTVWSIQGASAQRSTATGTQQGQGQSAAATGQSHTSTGATGTTTTSGSGTGVTVGTGTTTGSSASVQTSLGATGASTPVIGSLPASGLPLLEGQAVPTVPLQNQATSDAAYWARASESFFISAQNTSPASTSGSSDTHFVEAQPGQMLYLFAYDNSRNITADQTTWHVNSPDALITTDTVDEWSGGVNNEQQTLAYFTPTKPGIYTIQAENDGQYSVPIVITVGLSNLSEQPFSLPAAYTGIAPLPSNLTAVSPQTSGDVTYLPYAAQGNWIPVSGTVTGSFANKVHAITVVLNGATNAQEWDYRLPVDSSGHFAAMVESPFTGNISVSLVKNYLTLMTNASTNFSYPIDYQVTATGQVPSAQLQALLPSSAMDYNISPQFSQLADTLLENSTSLETAIAAINNYVAGDISYNNAELAPNAQYIFTDALTTWNEQSGVCENMAQLAAALLRSVGIPTQTVGGYANPSWTTPNYKDQSADDAHEWLNVWNGAKWQLFDPTWTAIEDASGIGYGITSEFSTNTSSLLATHAPVSDQIATSM